MSLDVLRAHYGMLGQIPDPRPAPQEFNAAFVAALETTDRWSFYQLAPLLIINFWDDFFLREATPEPSRGRLRFLGAIATFFIDFDSTGMPWPVKTRFRLAQLEDALVSYNMGSDPFRDEHLPCSRAPSLFHPHKLDPDWQLSGFWRCWTEALVRNKELLALFAEADRANGETRGEYEHQLEETMALPHDERACHLQDFIQGHTNPQPHPTVEPSGLPPF